MYVGDYLGMGIKEKGVKGKDSKEWQGWKNATNIHIKSV
jgi:hypothetical protein